MKNIILISLFSLAALCVNAQYQPSHMVNKTVYTAPAVFQTPGYQYFWGVAATDTLGASDTLTQIIRVYADGLVQFKPQITVTKVSGTVTNNFFVSASMDGVNWTAIDTVAYSNTATATAVLTDPDYTDFNWAFMRWQGISGATAQKAWYKVILMGRY